MSLPSQIVCQNRAGASNTGHGGAGEQASGRGRGIPGARDEIAGQISLGGQQLNPGQALRPLANALKPLIQYFECHG